MKMLMVAVFDTAEDPDFRSAGANKITNLSKELQFFEKVRASVHFHAYVHACILEDSSGVVHKAAEASIALCKSTQRSAALSTSKLRWLFIVTVYMITTHAQVQAAILILR